MTIYILYILTKIYIYSTCMIPWYQQEPRLKMNLRRSVTVNNKIQTYNFFRSVCGKMCLYYINQILIQIPMPREIFMQAPSEKGLPLKTMVNERFSSYIVPEKLNTILIWFWFVVWCVTYKIKSPKIFLSSLFVSLHDWKKTALLLCTFTNLRH